MDDSHSPASFPGLLDILHKSMLVDAIKVRGEAVTPSQMDLPKDSDQIFNVILLRWTLLKPYLIRKA